MTEQILIGVSQLDNLVQQVGVLINFDDFKYQNYQSASLVKGGITYVYQPFGFIGRSNNNQHPKILIPKHGKLIKAAINDRKLNGLPIWCSLQANDIFSNVLTETYIYSTIDKVQLHQDNIVFTLGSVQKSNGIHTYVN